MYDVRKEIIKQSLSSILKEVIKRHESIIRYTFLCLFLNFEIYIFVAFYMYDFEISRKQSNKLFECQWSNLLIN